MPLILVEAVKFGEAITKVLLNINMASSVFLRGMGVLEYLCEVTQHDVRQNRNPLSEEKKRKFTKEMKSKLESGVRKC